MATHPPYQQLITALLQPFLSQPEALRVDCEYMPTNARVWVRVAFAEVDKDKLVAEGNRHLYATKAILAAAAREAGQKVYLDLYDPTAGSRRGGGDVRSEPTNTESRPSIPPVSRVGRPIPRTEKP
jgi:uncharacterized protein